MARQVLPGLATLDYARRFMQIRMATESDAEASLRLHGRLDHETQFMMYEPEERTTTVEAQGESLRDILITGNSTVLLAKQGGSNSRREDRGRCKIPAA